MADRPMLFSTPIATTMDGQMFVLALANRVCQYLPDGWELRLCMEKGAAWVTLHNPDGDTIDLPDAADKSLEQQVNEALCEARAANATIAEIYQAATGATGEPGNWNGAKPVKERIAELKDENARMQTRLNFVTSALMDCRDHIPPKDWKQWWTIEIETNRQADATAGNGG